MKGIFYMRKLGIYVVALTAAALLSALSMANPAPQERTAASDRTDDASQASRASRQQASRLRIIGKIHPALPKTKLLLAEKCLFEIPKYAKAGDEVIGRVNLANNSFAPAKFSIVGGTGRGRFTIDTVANSRGKHFGVIRTAGKEFSQPAYTLKVKTKFTDGTTDEQEYTLNVVEETLAATFLDYVSSHVANEGRLGGKFTDDEVTKYLSQIEPDGTFSDLKLKVDKHGWESLQVAAERTKKMTFALLKPQSVHHNSDALRRAVFASAINICEVNDRFRTNWTDTHTWRVSDHMAGAAIRIYPTLQRLMASEVHAEADRAQRVYDALIDVCDNLWAERMDERPAGANANRNHRMRSLMVRAAISHDYNRSITDQEVWFDRVDVRIPGFYPNGALGDLMELAETNFVFMDVYGGRCGFLPDGTIVHHPRVGIQFNAGAYGWQWLTDSPLVLASLFKDTRYRASNRTYDIIADKILDTYRPLVYRGYLDASMAGLCPDRADWGERMMQAIDGLLNSKSADTLIAREAELRAYKTVLQNEQHRDDLSLNQPFWTIDFLVHRRPDYFASLKMNSVRSRGIERGIDRRSYYYMGDGALFVTLDGSEQNAIRDVIDWHAIPGITAEQRGKELPPGADSAYAGANGTNLFAGVLSDRQRGFGAFRYERNFDANELNYSTVNANKGAFFFDRQIVSLGNRIRRVRPGDGLPIHTVLNQAVWRSDIQYGDATGSRKTIPFDDADKTEAKTSVELTRHSAPAWFHHDRIGYIIVPARQPLSVVMQVNTRETPSRGKRPQSKCHPVFQLAVDHGADPRDSDYQYVILPNVSADDVEQFAQTIGTADCELVILRNDDDVMAVHHRKQRITQAAFFNPGSASLSLPPTDDGSFEPLKIQVDRPALVMTEQLSGQVNISVSDPMHSAEETVIQVHVNRPLRDVATGEVGKTLTFRHADAKLHAGRTVTRRFDY